MFWPPNLALIPFVTPGLSQNTKHTPNTESLRGSVAKQPTSTGDEKPIHYNEYKDTCETLRALTDKQQLSFSLTTDLSQRTTS